MTKLGDNPREEISRYRNELTPAFKDFLEWILDHSDDPDLVKINEAKASALMTCCINQMTFLTKFSGSVGRIMAIYQIMSAFSLQIEEEAKEEDMDSYTMEMSSMLKFFCLHMKNNFDKLPFQMVDDINGKTN